jgi:hypothetical protein
VAQSWSGYGGEEKKLARNQTSAFYPKYPSEIFKRATAIRTTYVFKA